MYGVIATESILTGLIVYAFEAIQRKEWLSKEALYSAVEGGIAIGVGNWALRFTNLLQGLGMFTVPLVAGLLYATERKFINKKEGETFMKNTGYLFVIAFVARSVALPAWTALAVNFQVNPNLLGTLSGVNSPVVPPSTLMYNGAGVSIPGYVTGGPGNSLLPFGPADPSLMSLYCGC